MKAKLCVLTKEDFLFLESFLLSWGYRRIAKIDKAKSFSRLQLQAPRKLAGSEVGFEYSNHGYTVVIWVSYLEEEGKWRDVGEDAIWILTREGDKALYFAKPFKRISGSILRVLRYAWITKWKVDHRPLCRECKAYMHISRRSNGRGYYWRCDHKEKHTDQKSVFENWDYKLPPKATEFVEIRRNYTAAYKERNEKAGKTPIPAAVIRKPWVKGTPENII